MGDNKSISIAASYECCRYVPRVVMMVVVGLLVLTLSGCGYIRMATWDAEGTLDPLFDSILSGSSGAAPGGESTPTPPAASVAEPAEVKPPDQFGTLAEGPSKARPIAFFIAVILLGAFVLNLIVTQRIKIRSPAAPSERSKGQHVLRVIGSPFSAIAAMLILIVVEWSGVAAAPAPTGWSHAFGNSTCLRYYPAGGDVMTSGRLVLTTSLVGNNLLTGDVDGDRKLETVTTCGDQLRIYDERFVIQARVTMPGDGRVEMIGDLNGDGIADIGVAGLEEFRGQAYFYDGSGRRFLTLIRDIDAAETFVPIAALDGDTVLMVERPPESQGAYGVYAYNVQTGQEEWGYDLGRGAGTPSLSDIDGDGRKELVVGWGNEPLDATHDYVTVFAGDEVRLVDVTAGERLYGDDGELVPPRNDNVVNVLVVDDDGTELMAGKYPASGNAQGVSVFVDLDRNGETEILGIERHYDGGAFYPYQFPGIEKACLYDSQGNELYSYGGQQNGNWMWAVADMDGDGKDNVILGGCSRLVILDEHLGEMIAVASDGQLELVCDLTGDGQPEIVTARAFTGLKIFNSSLTPVDEMELTITGPVVASDVNADGVVELLVPTTDDEVAVVAFARE
jgi:hypothetical protein